MPLTTERLKLSNKNKDLSIILPLRSIELRSGNNI